MRTLLSKQRFFLTAAGILPAVFFCAAAAPAWSAQQQPPQTIDLSKFPAASVDEVVVPVPSEIFNVLDKLGTPNWRAQLRSSFGKNTGNRAQVALLLGTVIADGFIAVQAQDSERVKEIGREVLVLAEAIGVQDAVMARSKSIVDKAQSRDWLAVKREFDGALQDVRGAMQELNDDDLAQLVSLGGWLRGTQVLTAVVRENYSKDSAELLHQPDLILYFQRRIDGMSGRLANEEVVVQVRRTLERIRPLVGRRDGSNIPVRNVERIHQLATESVNFISMEG
jgi:hypothetical protein